MPLNWHFSNLDAGTGANNTAIVAKDWCCGSRLGKHEHLNVKDPALGVHVGDDVRERCTREDLETALSVANARCSRGSENHENKVERSHEEVSQSRPLD